MKTWGILSDLVKVIKTAKEKYETNLKAHEALISICNHSTSEYLRLQSLLSPNGRPSAESVKLDR